MLCELVKGRRDDGDTLENDLYTIRELEWIENLANMNDSADLITETDHIEVGNDAPEKSLLLKLGRALRGHAEFRSLDANATTAEILEVWPTFLNNLTARAIERTKGNTNTVKTQPTRPVPRQIQVIEAFFGELFGIENFSGAGDRAYMKILKVASLLNDAQWDRFKSRVAPLKPSTRILLNSISKAQKQEMYERIEKELKDAQAAGGQGN